MSTTKIVTTAAVAVILPIVLIAAATGAIVSVLAGRSRLDCAPAGSPATGVVGYGPDQMTNAATIVALGKQLNVPEQGWVVAIAAALAESGLRNLNYGDRDSLGLFQQRPSQGWGTPAQIMNPTYSATQFYQHLLGVHGWLQMSVNDAAQAVERSGFPDAYAPHELAAREIVGAVHGFSCTATGSGDCDHVQTPNSAALAGINYACRQRGLPYVWGRTTKRRHRIRLLWTHDRRLRCGRDHPAPHRRCSIPSRPPGPPRSIPAARRSGVLRHSATHPPRGSLPRWTSHDRRTGLRPGRQNRALHSNGLPGSGSPSQSTIIAVIPHA